VVYISGDPFDDVIDPLFPIIAGSARQGREVGHSDDGFADLKQVIEPCFKIHMKFLLMTE